MHSCLAVATSEFPLGLTAVKFRTRKKFKGTNALKRKIIATEECPDNDTKVKWKLLTDLPVINLAEATEKLEWHSHHWKT